MKKNWLVFMTILVVVLACVFLVAASLLIDFTPIKENIKENSAFISTESTENLGSITFEQTFFEDEEDHNIPSLNDPYPYKVYSYDRLLGGYKSLDEAITVASKHKQSYVKRGGDKAPLWDNLPKFAVKIGEASFWYDSFAEAVTHARLNSNSYITFLKNNRIIWENKPNTNRSHKIADVPLINQNPELFRGCEVTSLAMLINFMGIEVDKMTLAEEVRKDPTEMSIINGKTHFGNPDIGFVGDMYDSRNNGLGVYHKPIYDLLKNYFPEAAVNLTGCEFSDLYEFINNDMPVWVITNSRYSKLNESSFETWSTPTGDIKITYSMHSVLITGYDDEYIYFNDPYNVRSYYRKADFIEAWYQMGSQAVVVIK